MYLKLVSQLAPVAYKKFSPQNKTKQNKENKQQTENQQKMTQVLLECLPKIFINSTLKQKKI